MQYVFRYGKLAALLGVFVAISVTIASVPSSTILELIGSNNAYVLMFLLGMIGGLSTFVGIPYHFILMSLAAGGLNPILLGLATAVGVMGGDSVMYVFCRNLKTAFSPKLQATLEHVSTYIDAYPHLITPGLFLYGALSPFSNDFVVATMSLKGHPYIRTIVPLMLGNCVFNITIAYLGLYAYDWIVAWL